MQDLKRPNYAAEWKWDGTRLVVQKEKDHVTLQNRNGIIYTRRLPEVTLAAEKILGTYTVDGEVVYINPETGKVEFTPCQRRCSTQDWAKILYLQRLFPVTVKLFDALEVNGKNIENRPLRERKEILYDLISKHIGVFHFVEYGWNKEEQWKQVLEQGEEGLILKDINSGYEHERSWKWLKIKNWRHQICDVVGYTPGKNARAGFFGSLVLAKDGKFIGKAGSGPNDWELRQLKDRLDDAPKTARPFIIGEYYTAVKTNLKVKVKYYKITEAGVMRFPIFEEIVN